MADNAVGDRVCRGLACYLMAGSDHLVREGPDLPATLETSACTTGLITHIQLADGTCVEVPSRHAVYYV